MSIDDAASHATAYDTYGELLSAALNDRNWRPTLTVGASDGLRMRRAKEMLKQALERDGVEVFDARASENIDEETITDDLGTAVANDMVLDAAVAFGDAVQDVLQDNAKSLVQIFVRRSDGDMLARHEDVEGMADDVVREALGNEDLRSTLVQLARSGLRKMVG